MHPWPVATHLQSCVLTRQTVHCPQVLPLDSVTLHDLCSLLGLLQCIKNTSSFACFIASVWACMAAGSSLYRNLVSSCLTHGIHISMVFLCLEVLWALAFLTVSAWIWCDLLLQRTNSLIPYMIGISSESISTGSSTSSCQYNTIRLSLQWVSTKVAHTHTYTRSN